MILMRNNKVIVYTKRNQNSFTLELAQTEKAMATINIKNISTQIKRIAIYGQGQFTHLISQNKCIHLWYQ